MKKILFRLLIIIICIYAILYFLPVNETHKKSIFAKGDGEVLIIAHGGFKALNPENTWMAFDYAYENGADILEVDVCISKDGYLVATHDGLVDRFTNHTGPIIDYTLAELEMMNFGEKFTALDNTMPYKDADLADYGLKLAPANLEEMFKKYGKDVGYIIEIKDVDENYTKAANTLIELIAKYDMQDYVCVASFSEDAISYVRSKVDDEYITSFDFTTSAKFIFASFFNLDSFMHFKHSGFQLPMEQYKIPLATKFLINKIHKHDMFIHYWTINTKEEMRKLIELGADGIITDRLDLLKEVLEEYK